MSVTNGHWNKLLWNLYVSGMNNNCIEKRENCTWKMWVLWYNSIRHIDTIYICILLVDACFCYNCCCITVYNTFVTFVKTLFFLPPLKFFYLQFSYFFFFPFFCTHLFHNNSFNIHYLLFQKNTKQTRKEKRGNYYYYAFQFFSFAHHYILSVEIHGYITLFFGLF